MNRKKGITLWMLVAVLEISCCHQLLAQEVGVWYDAEMQTDFKGHSNYVNLLYLSADCPMGEHFGLSAASISILKSREESLLDDLQTFSNIEADQQPFTLAVAGLSWNPTDRHKLFAGIYNVNEDYFDSPVTTLFLNSSCGIFPTLSCNMDIANYPVASMGVHYGYTAPEYRLQASVYNGQGYDRLTGASSIWRVTPKSDGLFCITQADWQLRNGHYYVGAAQHTGVKGRIKPQTALWTYTEQALTERITLIADYSHAFGQETQCRDFVGLGGQYTWSKNTLGAFTDYARFRNDKEWATELTYKYQHNAVLFLQASWELIHHGSWMTAGMIRVSVRI